MNSEFVAGVPAVYDDKLPSSVRGGSDHVTVEHHQTEGIGHSVVWPRDVVEHRHVTVYSRL